MVQSNSHVKEMRLFNRGFPAAKPDQLKWMAVAKGGLEDKSKTGRCECRQVVALGESLAVSAGLVGACPASSVRIVSVAADQ